MTMDPKVCGKLLTTHRRGYGVDVEALHGRLPLRQSADEGSKMRSRGYRRLRRWKLCFVVLLDVFGVRSYIGGRSTSVAARGAHETGGTPYGGRPPISWRPRLLLDLHSKSSGSCSFQKSRSRRFHSVWTPFDIPFLRNTEIGKKNSNMGWASG